MELPALDRAAFAQPLCTTNHLWRIMIDDYSSRTTSEPPLHTLLRRRRQELNLRQADVAAALNISAEAVTLWESGRRRMELAKLPRIAQVLQLDARELCLRALAEFYPTFHNTLFGPRNSGSVSIQPAA
jgi:DNA-binding transcriptional regulator YiaG